MRVIEKSYLFVFRNLKRAVNPVKKRVIKTECKVHKFINNQSLIILKNDGYLYTYRLMSLYINEINAGVVWADQDLKSSNHFYNPHTDKGLYGNSNAKKECLSYYKKALKEYSNGNTKEAMFFLGAACHLIQDLTVPQHANVKLLDNHRGFEKWVINAHRHHDEFRIDKGGIYLNSIALYICLNSRKAIKTYKKFAHIKNQVIRFYNTTAVILIMAQRTTAGLMHKFYKDINKIRKPFLLKISLPITPWKIKSG